MASLIFSNNATTTLSGSINNSQTTISVINSGLFPVLSGGDYFYATMYEVSGSTEINIEIVKVTAISGTTWTIVRGQDGTTARSRAGITTVYIELRWTSASATLMLQKDNNLSDLPDAATARANLGLGTMATQAANNVSITGGSITGVSIQTLDSSTTIADNVDSTKKVAFEVSGVTTGTTRTLTVPNASGTIALTSDLTAGYQPLDSDLTALAALAANGIIARTGTGAVAVRTIAVPASGLTITNADGVSGNPTLALSDDLAAVEALGTTGFVRRTGASTWAASALVDADLPTALTGKTYNALSLTANATGFTVAGGTTSKSLTVGNNLTLNGTDGTTITLPATNGTVALNNQTFYIGTTSVAINRGSGSLSLTGVNIDGSAGSAATATTATSATNVAGGAANRIPFQTGAGATDFIVAPTVTNTFLQWNGTGFQWSTSVTTAVSSVDISSSDMTVTGGPITSSGTISLALNTVGIAKGGTGATTKTAAYNALSPMSTLGDVEYHDGTNGVRLAGNTTTTRKFFRQTGTGAASAAPVWDTLVDGDVPSTLTGKTYNGLTLTSAATGFTIAGGTTSKTLTVSNTLTLAGTDSSTLNIGSGGTLGSAAFTASTAYAPAAGSSSITTVGTITSGTWTGSAIGIGAGGTGQTTKTAAFDALAPTTTLGDTIYYDGTDNVRLAGNTTTSKRFLTQTGTGAASAAPGWNAIVDGDIPSALTGKTYNGLTLTANATGFSVAGGTTSKTLTVNNNLTFSGTDGSTLNIGGGGTLGTAAYTASTAYQPADADLTAIAALAGTSGLLKKTAASTWSLDTSTYLTANQSITISGDASGTGTTAITLTLATVPVNKGGTGATTLTGLIKGNGTSAFTAAVAGTDYVVPSALSSYLTTASAASTYQTQAGMSSYLTTSSASSTYAPLASPTFTGNIGLGASILSGTASHIFIPSTGTLSGVGSSINITNNLRYTTNWVTNSTATSGMYSISGNSHTWYGAASATSGTAPALNTLATLDNTGKLTANVLVGGTASLYTSVNYAVIDATLGAVLAVNGTSKAVVESTAVRPSTDNSTTSGTAANRWSVVYAATGTINTSDARLKTPVSAFTPAEVNAAKQLSREIGVYQWLESVAQKGAGARKHIGLTVQHAIQIMECNGLDPFAYGFICYDQWDDKIDIISDEVVTPAGDRYSFRYDELTLFIARGIEARLSALEGI